MHISPSRRRTAGPTHTSRRRAGLFSFAMFAVLACGEARAQDTFKPPPPVTYTEKFEVYGGASFLNGQAGQNLPKRYNMGGGEGRFTYWVTPKWGAVGDFRYELGTSPVLPAAETLGIQRRPLVSQTIGMGGVQYHFRGTQRAAVNFHALAGVAHGSFDHSRPSGVSSSDFFTSSGLYTNRSSAMGVAGGSLDLNRSARLAFRLSPEIVFEHFGDETREFFSVSAGVLYRFGTR